MNETSSDMMRRASVEATGLDGQILDAGHILLALARVDDTPAARVLHEAGATHEAIGRVYRSLIDQMAHGPDDSIRPRWMWNVAGATLVAFAEGMAVAQGLPLADAHFLLAIVWNEHALSAVVLRKLGVDRAGLVADLGRLGVPIPAAQPPADPPPVDWDERVELRTEELRPVLRELARQVKGQRNYAFNHDGKGHATIIAARGIPLVRIVNEVLGSD
jgi:ClpA/ClpB-like protein